MDMDVRQQPNDGGPTSEECLEDPLLCGLPTTPTTTKDPQPIDPLPTGMLEPTTAVMGPPTTTTQAAESDEGAADATVIVAPSSTVGAVSSNSGGSNGVSKGAVAGIAIGTAIMGAAIAFLITFFLFKRRSKRATPTLGKYESVPEPDMGKGPTPYLHDMSQVPPPPPSSGTPNAMIAATGPGGSKRVSVDPSIAFLASALPPPASEDAIRARVLQLFDHITRHVETFYRDVHASVTPSMEADLAKFGRGNVPMAELLQSGSAPTTAIKHALMSYVLALTAPDIDGDDRDSHKHGGTLFPSEVIGIGARGAGNAFMGSPDLSTPYALHRRLSSHLHSALISHPSLSPTSTSISRSAALQAALRNAAEHFSLTFFPWANPATGDDSDRDDDLLAILHSALDTMVWLWGQEGVYEIVWSAGAMMRGLVVRPGLVRRVAGSETGVVMLEVCAIGT